MKKKVKKIVLVIILLLIIALIVFLGNTFRKYLIIKDLNEKFSVYESSENYYKKLVTTFDSARSSVLETYVKGENQYVLMKSISSNGEVEVSQKYYCNGKTTNIYEENLDDKSAELNVEETDIFIVDIYNYLESESKFETFRASSMAHIEKAEYNGTECYKITNFITSSILAGNEITEVYIEVETGLCLKATLDDTIYEYEYEFDNVDDSVFVEPDINEYTIVED